MRHTEVMTYAGARASLQQSRWGTADLYLSFVALG